MTTDTKFILTPTDTLASSYIISNSDVEFYRVFLITGFICHD